MKKLLNFLPLKSDTVMLDRALKIARCTLSLKSENLLKNNNVRFAKLMQVALFLRTFGSSRL